MEKPNMYACPKCKRTFNLVSDDPTKTIMCDKCNVPLVPIECTRGEWENLSAEEKAEIVKTAVGSAAKDVNVNLYVPKIAKDINTIKNIMVFSLILSIIAACLSLFRCGR